MKVGVLGLGIMGSSIAKRLKSVGYKVYGWNRTYEKALKLREYGIEIHKDINNVIEESDVIIIMVADDNAVMGVISKVQEKLKNKIVINMATTTDDLNISLSNMFKCFVEAPVIGSGRDIENGNAIIIVSAKEECYDKVKDLLKYLGSHIVYLKDYGKASSLKLIFNAMLMVSHQLFSELLSIALKSHVDINSLKEVFSKTVFKEYVNKYIDRLLSKEPPVGFKLKWAAKDLQYALKLALKHKIAAYLISTSYNSYETLSKTELGEKDYSRISRLYIQD